MRIFVLLVSLFAGPALGQSLQLDGDKFNEALRPSAEISGAVIAGLQIHSKSTLSSGFDPMLPALNPNQPVCVRIVSANGLYDAENQYMFSDAAAPDGPMINVEENSDYADFWKDLQGQEVTAAVTLGPCTEAPETFFIAAWAQEDAEKASLFVNSLRADTVVLRDEGTGQNVRCAPVEIDVRSAYDTVCSVDLQGRSGPVDLSVFRFVNRQPSPPTTLKLILTEK